MISYLVRERTLGREVVIIRLIATIRILAVLSVARVMRAGIVVLGGGEASEEEENGNSGSRDMMSSSGCVFHDFCDLECFFPFMIMMMHLPPILFVSNLRSFFHHSLSSSRLSKCQKPVLNYV